MTVIRTLAAQEILDSRQTPTIEVQLSTDSGTVRASVPSGASVGSREALELRDGDQNRFNGKGVLHAIAGIQEIIIPQVVGKEFDQLSLDNFLCELDGTPNKSRLGANAILAVSIAFARAAALEAKKELYTYIAGISGNTLRIPIPMCNILNGGKHTKDGIEIQECMLVPTGITSIRSQIEVLNTCIKTLEHELEVSGFDTTLGDEGGFAPKLSSNEQALQLLSATILSSGFSFETIRIALDVAATSFHHDGFYILHSKGQEEKKTATDLIHWYETIAHQYPLISIEDPFNEDDWDSFVSLNKTLNGSPFIVGDDLLVTNSTFISEAAKRKAVGGAIIKPNQVGTLSESIQAVNTARNAGMQVCASHRSGETLDTFIADFAVGIGADFIKAGAPTKPERAAKYDRLIEIESKL